MKIGLDVHGVIDVYPDLFSRLSNKWTRMGHEVHILTGKEWKTTYPKIVSWDIAHSRVFSIVDYHQELGTYMIKKESGWWMDEETWNRSKGDYCKREKLDFHFDNDLKYAQWFPECCHFVLVRPANFEKLEKLFLSPEQI